MKLPETCKKADERIINFMNRYSVLVTRLALGIVFIWFGALKPMGLSPAHDLVVSTFNRLPHPDWITADAFVHLLGWWEVAIGLGFLYRPLVRLALVLLVLQLPGTILPLFLLPADSFTIVPHGLTLEGQYIIKNLVLIGGALVVGGSLREQGTDRRL